MIEYIKIAISFLTPVSILIIGILINKRLEKNKIELAKEKDWQTHWADLFIKTANELNETISLMIVALFETQKTKDEIELKEIDMNLKKYHKIISINEWNIRNYVQFAKESRTEVIDNLQDILDGLTSIFDNRGGNIEPIRQKQFDFNKSVRKAHTELLKTKTVHNRCI